MAVNDGTSTTSENLNKVRNVIFHATAEAAAESVVNGIYTVAGIADNATANIVKVVVPHGEQFAQISFRGIAMTDEGKSMKSQIWTLVIARQSGTQPTMVGVTTAFGKTNADEPGSTLNDLPCTWNNSATSGANTGEQTFYITANPNPATTTTCTCCIVYSLYNKNANGVTVTSAT